MKKHVYLIMAHGDWSLLSKLFVALDDARNDLYVHIDAKANFQKSNVYHPQFAGIKYIKRTNVSRGGDSLIKCELELLKSAINGGYAYYHLLSGQDLPIKSQNYIHAFFDKNTENNYIKIDSNAMTDGYHLNRV